LVLVSVGKLTVGACLEWRRNA